MMETRPICIIISQLKVKQSKYPIGLRFSGKQAHLFSLVSLLALGRFIEHWDKTKNSKQFEK